MTGRLGRDRRWWLGLVLAGAACRPVSMPPSGHTDLFGDPAPGISRRAVDNRAVDLEALRGKVVVIEFFARYCEPCWKHLPRLQRWADRHRDVAVIGVGADEKGRDTLEMVRALEITFPVVHDMGLTITARYHVDRIPTTFVLDRAGRVRWTSFSGSGVAALDRAVEVVRRERD